MIDPNKTYRTRDGRAVRIYAINEGQPLPVHGATYDGCIGWTVRQWDEEGWPSHMWKDQFTLIEVPLADELRDQIPWEALRPEIKYVAMNNSGTWSGFADKPRMFTGGGPDGECAGWLLTGYPQYCGMSSLLVMPDVDPDRWQETLIERPEDR